MAAGDIFQLTAVANLNGVPVANVYYLKVLDDSGTTDALSDAADTLENQILLKLIPFQVISLEYECILGRQVSPLTSPARVFALSLVGDLVEQEFPANVAIKFPHSSGIGNKNQRGRYFIPGLTKVRVSNGRINQDNEVLYQAFIDAVLDTITQSGRTYRMQHHSTKLKQFFDILTMRVEPVPVKLRNRTPGVCSIS